MSEINPFEADEIENLNNILKGTRYKPLIKISYGSFGEIFKIQDDKQDYVLKVISKQQMTNQCKLHEAVIEGFMLSRLAHPGVVKYIQTIQSKDYICQVMEYCPYSDLFSVLKKVNKSMELLDKRKQIMLFYSAQVLQALSYIHSKNIIHRDIKLENIVVAADLNARIIDFGTAKPVKMEDFYSSSQIQFLTQLRETENKQVVVERSKSFVGSANYISPQSISLEYTLASDIWSFGVMVYKMFHGKLPFEGANNYQIFKKIKLNELELGQGLQPTMKDFLLQCLNPSPSERPTCFQLKKHPYFKDINFESIFKSPCPISQQQMQKMYETPQVVEAPNNKFIDFEVVLQKKMFFGNFKPRIMKVYKKGDNLYMSYWYLEGKKPKNEFELLINDYAERVNKSEFDVFNKDLKYTFKVSKQGTVEQIVNSINSIIRKHYDLE